MKRILISCALALGLSAPTVMAENACTGETPCTIGERSYHVLPPDDWDGHSPLPVLMHFHGWGRTGLHVTRNGRVAGATRRRGVLLVAPNGLRNSWSFWDDGDTRDVQFARAVLEDVAKHYPIQDGAVFVGGYSFGSAMAWRFACEAGNDVDALLGISGTLFGESHCRQAPREVRHVHGTADTVMDFPFGPGGDTTYPVALWRDEYRCTTGTRAPDWQQVDFLTFQRTEWQSCQTGKVTLDIHPGGHFIPHGWVARQLDELLNRPFSYP